MQSRIVFRYQRSSRFNLHLFTLIDSVLHRENLLLQPQKLLLLCQALAMDPRHHPIAVLRVTEGWICCRLIRTLQPHST